MIPCNHCEVLSPPLAGPGTLYVACQLPRTRGKLRRSFMCSGLPFDDPADGVLAVEVGPGALGRLGELILDDLTAMELGASRALLVEAGGTFGVGDLARMQDLGTLVGSARGGWLFETLREERLAVHFQPIVPADDAGEVFAYECLLRGLRPDGAMISPLSMFDAARSAGMLYYLDRIARLRAIEEISYLGLDTPAFINFDPGAIHDPSACLRSTLEAVERSKIPAEGIVFEVTDSGGIRDARHLEGILAHYREAGFRVALDDLGPGSADLLVRLRPDFVKLDRVLVRDVDSDPSRAAVAAWLLKLANDLGVQIIAEGVETAAQGEWLAAHGAHFLQGYFLAPPDPTPPVPALA